MSKAADGRHRLIEAGKSLVREGGFEALKMRDVAARSGLNLAMYHYYFKTKESFMSEIIASFLQEMGAETADLNRQSAGLTPLGRLKAYLVFQAQYMKRHDRLIFNLLSGAGHGDKLALMVLKQTNSNIPHEELRRRVEECQKLGLIDKTSPFVIGNMMLGLLLSWAVSSELFMRTYSEEIRKKAHSEGMVGELTDQQIETVVMLLIKGILTDKGRRALVDFEKKA